MVDIPTPIWKLSPAERAAAFEKASAGMKPAEKTAMTVTEQVHLLLPLIRKKRQQGFTVEQISAMMKGPDIRVDASVTSIRRALAQAAKQDEEAKKSRLAGVVPASPSTGSVRGGGPVASQSSA